MCYLVISFKGALSGLRQFLATESPSKMMRNYFHFTLKALFVLKIQNVVEKLFPETLFSKKSKLSTSLDQ